MPMMRSGDAMEGGERGVTRIHYRNNRFGVVVSLIYILHIEDT
jgi:hypothetical protein